MEGWVISGAKIRPDKPKLCGLNSITFTVFVVYSMSFPVHLYIYFWNFCLVYSYPVGMVLALYARVVPQGGCGWYICDRDCCTIPVLCTSQIIATLLILESGELFGVWKQSTRPTVFRAKFHNNLIHFKLNSPYCRQHYTYLRKKI